MREFKLTESKQEDLQTYTIVVDGNYHNSRGFILQEIYSYKLDNPNSFMNVFFTLNKAGKVVDVSVQVND